MKKMEYVNALRELADYLESRDFPDTRPHWWTRGEREDIYPTPSLYVALRDAETFKSFARAMGSFEKQYDTNDMEIVHRFPSGVYVKAYVNREQVCKKKVVGERIIPAEPERTEIIPATEERTEEIVEWECPESLIKTEEKENVNA